MTCTIRATSEPAERELKDLKGIDIFRLVAESRVSISIKGGGLTRARVTLTNAEDRPVTVIIPAAAMFASRNPKVQNMVTTTSKLVVLRPNETKSLSVPVACANLPRKAPGSSDELYLEQVANRPTLQRVVQHMHKLKAPFPVRQAAVWVVTDNATYRGLSVLNTMTADHAVRAFRLLVESGIDLRQFRIWQDAVQLLQTSVSDVRDTMQRSMQVESNAIWLFEHLERNGDAQIRAALNDEMLNRAAAAGWARMISTLVDKGYDVNNRNEREQTPLHGFIKHARYKPFSPLKSIVSALIGAGADVNAKDQRGRTPIFYADPAKGFEVLAAAGADLHVVDEQGMTLLHVIDLRLHEASKALDVLREAGLDINQPDNKGNTPLHHAVRTADRDKIRGLLQLGATSTPNQRASCRLVIDQFRSAGVRDAAWREVG